MIKPKILLLEDDINLSESLVEYLSDCGYEVEPLYDGEKAYEAIYEKSYDLLLLDVHVPIKDGFKLLREVRENSITTPAIFITSLNSIDDLSFGYESGCDDYIRKPFELKELLFRIQTIIKRGFFHPNSDKLQIDKNIYFDTATNELIVNKNRVEIHNKEAKLLKLFLQNKNEILVHEVIYNTLWDYEEIPSETSLRTYIKNLRKVLGKDKIVSIKKLGYKFVTY